MVVLLPKLHHLLLHRHAFLSNSRGTGFANGCIVVATCTVSKAAVASWPLSIALNMSCQLVNVVTNLSSIRSLLQTFAFLRRHLSHATRMTEQVDRDNDRPHVSVDGQAEILALDLVHILIHSQHTDWTNPLVYRTWGDVSSSLQTRVVFPCKGIGDMLPLVLGSH
jgi:hypothetical protein